MNSLNKNFRQEMDMVRKALSCKEGKNELAEYLTPIIRSEGESAIKKWEVEKGIYISEKQRNEAMEEGWLAIPFALSKYKEKLDLFDKGEEVEIYKISEYLPWLVRQAVVRHLDSLTNEHNK